ncbi:MAG: hypothetical protein PHG05_02625 [Candidatus Nanoarchaeia archaeon]|nr:hypothetical protein [Candidatus Nanoarchaeia archaeon]
MLTREMLNLIAEDKTVSRYGRREQEDGASKGLKPRDTSQAVFPGCNDQFWLYDQFGILAKKVGVDWNKGENKLELALAILKSEESQFEVRGTKYTGIEVATAVMLDKWPGDLDPNKVQAIGIDLSEIKDRIRLREYLNDLKPSYNDKKHI